MKNAEGMMVVANLSPNPHNTVLIMFQGERIEIHRRLQMVAGLEREGKHVGVRNNRC